MSFKSLSRKLLVFLGISMIFTHYVSAKCQIIDTFDQKEASAWIGCKIDTESIREGTGSLEWPLRKAPITTKKIGAQNWTEFNVLEVWIYSDSISNGIVELWLASDSDKTPRTDYYKTSFQVSWQGWRLMRFPFSSFEPLGEPAGWWKIEEVILRVKTLNQTQRLLLDSLVVKSDENLGLKHFEGNNLFKNGSFEKVAANGMPYDWGTWLPSSPPPRVQIDKEIKNSGENSISLYGSNQDARGSLNQRVDIIGGHEYLFRVRVRVRGVNLEGDHGVVLRLPFYKADGAVVNVGNAALKDYSTNTTLDLRFGYITFYLADCPEDQWREISANIIAPPEAVALKLEMFLWFSQGLIWFDDVELIDLGEAKVETGDTGEFSPRDLATTKSLELIMPKAEERVKVNPPIFIWTGEAERYLVEFAQDVAFTNPKQMEVTVGNFAVPTWTFEEGQWFWRVTAIQKGGSRKTSSASSFEMQPKVLEFPMVTKEQIETAIPQGHPRLFFLESEIKEFRENTTPEHKEVIAQLETMLEQWKNKTVLPDPAPYAGGVWNNADWSRIMSDATYAHNVMVTYAFAYAATGKQEYALEAKKWLLGVCNWNPKGSTSDESQDEASRLLLEAISLTYDWLYDELSPQEKKKVLEIIEIRGTEMFNVISKSRRIEIDPYDSHGWHKVGVVAEAAVAVYHESQSAKAWLDYTLPLLARRWPAWGGVEGGWSEGVGYNAAYLNRYLKSADAIQKSVGIYLYDNPWFKNGIWFQFYGRLPQTTGAEFGDVRPMLPNLEDIMNYQRLAMVENNPYLQWYVDMAGGFPSSIPPGKPELFLWLDKRLEPKPPVDLPKAKAFGDVGFAFLHSNLTDPTDNILFAFKSGPYGSISHSHADQNSFHIVAFGERLAIDSGYYDSWGSAHHTRWTRTTAAHNTLLVNNIGQPLNKMGTGSLTGFITSNYFDFVSGEAASAYEGRLKKFERNVVYLRPDYYVIFDDIQGRGGVSYDWLLHSLKKMDLDPNAQTIKISSGKAKLDVQFLEPANLNLQQSDRFPVNPTGTFENQWHLKATTQSDGKGQFLVVLHPYKDGAKNEKQITKISSNSGIGVKLEDESQTHLVGFSYSKPLEIEGVVTDGKAFALGLLEKLPNSMMIEKGTQLSYKGISYYTATSTGTTSFGFSEGKLEGQIELENDGTVSIRMPEKAVKVYVDGAERQFDFADGAVSFQLEAGSHKILVTTGDATAITTNLLKVPVTFGGNQKNDCMNLLSDGKKASGIYIFGGKSGAYSVKLALSEQSDPNGTFKIRVDRRQESFKSSEYKGQELFFVINNRNAVILELDEGVEIEEIQFAFNTTSIKQKALEWSQTPIAKDPRKAIIISAGDYLAEGGGRSNKTGNSHNPRYGKGIMDWGTPEHWLEWEFSVKESGRYMVMIGAATTYPVVQRYLSIDGKFPRPEFQLFEISDTGGWGYELKQWGNFILSDSNGEPLIANLESGTHKVRMGAIYSHANLDYIAFIPVK